MARLDAKKVTETYRLLQENYPETFEWAQHKARWEQMPIGAVITEYSDYIDQLMREEAQKRITGSVVEEDEG